MAPELQTATPAHLPTLPSAHRHTTTIRSAILPCPALPWTGWAQLRTHLDHNLQCQLGLQGFCQPQAHGGGGVCGNSTASHPKVVSATCTNALTHQPTPSCLAEQPSRLSLNLMLSPRDRAGGGERFRWERRGKSGRQQRCVRRAQPALRSEESKGARECEWKGTVFPLPPPPL